MPLAAPPGPLWTADEKEPHPREFPLPQAAAAEARQGNHRIPQVGISLKLNTELGERER